MNELDGDIRRFLTRLTDASPEVPDAAVLLDHAAPPAGRPVARLVGALAIAALVVAGAVAVRERGDAPSTVGASSTPTPTVLCAYVPRLMPNLVGRPLADAREELGKPCVEARVEAHEIPSSDVAPGVVLTQSVAAGSIAPFRGVVVVEVAVASEAEVACPLVAARVLSSVVGMSVEQARSVLGTPCLRFALVIEEVTDQSVPPGVIVDQRPAAGALVAPGSEVRLTVAAARSEARGYVVLGSFTLGDGTRRIVELEPGGICTSRGDDSTRGCDTLPALSSPIVVLFGGAEDPQDLWGLLDPGLTIRVERDGVAVAVQQTTEPVAGHLAFYGPVPAGGRVTIQVVDGSGAVVERLDDLPR